MGNWRELVEFLNYVKRTKEINMIIQCKCKCGTEFEEYDSQGRKREYINGHSRRGKTLSPETRQLLSDAKSGENNPNYGKHPSPETRRKMSENHADVSGENHPMYGKHHSPEARQKMSGENNPMYGRCGENNPMYGRRGENCPNWQGGISKEPYCPIWTKWFKEEIKERDNFQCQNPDCSKQNLTLSVHHIDYDKKNCSAGNLITLCRSCNSKANHDREYWKEFFINIMNNRFGVN